MFFVLILEARILVSKGEKRAHREVMEEGSKGEGAEGRERGTQRRGKR